MLKNSIKEIIGFILCVCILFGGVAVYNILQNKPKISVILPTYNREIMLKHALNSLLRQTYSDFEVIVIDDGSVDNTWKILKEYADKDKRIKIIRHKQNKGMVYGLNEGLELAKGKYIARLDDDDLSYPERFKKQVAYMEEHPDVAVVGAWAGKLYDDKVYGWWQETEPEYIKIRILLGETPLAHSSFFMRRSFLEEHGIRYNSKYQTAEDLSLLGDVVVAGGKIANIPEKLLYVRLHRSNPKQFYDNQKGSRERFIKDYLKLIFDIDIEGDIPDRCSLFKIIKDKNQKSFINPEKMDQIVLDGRLGC